LTRERGRDGSRFDVFADGEDDDNNDDEKQHLGHGFLELENAQEGKADKAGNLETILLTRRADDANLHSCSRAGCK